MRRKLSGAALLCFVIALVVGMMTKRDLDEEGELVKSFRDPDRVDQRWLFVTGFGTAAVCFAAWWMYEKKK